MSNLAFLRSWTEPQPELPVMTDTEILDFASEYVEGMSYVPGTYEIAACYILDVDMVPSPVRGRTLRDAIRLGKALVDEVNK
jgi:hypothetical protein